MDEIKIYNSREAAYLDLLVTSVKKGDILMRHYYTDLTKENQDVLIAYALEDSNGYPESLDNIKLISGNSKQPIHKILYEIPDVTDMVHGEFYLYVKVLEGYECYLIFLENNVRRIAPFTTELKRLYNLEDGKEYFVNFTTFKRLDDFITESETKTIKETIEKTFIEKLDTEIEKLTEKQKEDIETLRNEQGEGLEEIRQLVYGLRDNEIALLMKEVFPITLSFTLGQTIAEIGSTVKRLEFKNIVVKRKSNGVESSIIDDCDFTVSDGSNTYELKKDTVYYIEGEITETTTFTLTAHYKLISGFSSSKSASISFVYKSYYGVYSFTEPENIHNKLSSELRTKSTLTKSFNLNLTTTIYYIYPKSYGKLTAISDGTLPYLTDYDCEEYTIDGVDYYKYKKKTPVDITGLKQIYTF